MARSADVKKRFVQFALTMRPFADLLVSAVDQIVQSLARSLRACSSDAHSPFDCLTMFALSLFERMPRNAVAWRSLLEDRK